MSEGNVKDVADYLRDIPARVPTQRVGDGVYLFDSLPIPV